MVPTTNIEGLDLHYEIVGDGPAIAFIHGRMGGAASSACSRSAR